MSLSPALLSHEFAERIRESKKKEKGTREQGNMTRTSHSSIARVREMVGERRDKHRHVWL